MRPLGFERRSSLVLGLSGALLLMAWPLVAVAAEPSLQTILSANLEARGGAAAWKAVRSLRLTGTIDVGDGQRSPLTVEFKRPQKVRVEFLVQGERGVQAFDGTTAWAILPFAGGTPIRLPPEQAKDVMEQADFEGPLVDSARKGVTIELVGQETIDGSPAHHLRVTRKSGEVSDLWLDATSFLEVRQSTERTIQGAKLSITVELGDYRKAGGLSFAHRIEQTVSIAPALQVLQFETVEVDPEIPDEHFAFPAAAPAP